MTASYVGFVVAGVAGFVVAQSGHATCREPGAMSFLSKMSMKNAVSMLQTRANQDFDPLFCRRDAGATTSSPQVFAIVPGFGTYQHMSMVQNNIRWLQKQDAQVVCSIFVYKSEAEFPLTSDDLRRLAPCSVHRSRGHWMDFISRAPAEALNTADYVLVWFDDVIIQPGARLRRMFEIMTCNGLSVLTPTYPRDEVLVDGNAVIYRPTIMTQQQNDRAVGHRVNFVEYNFNLMSSASFRCLQSMFEPENTRGWGVAEWFSAKCPGYCMGVMDELLMHDTSTGSYSHDKAERDQYAYMDKHGWPEIGGEGGTGRGQIIGTLVDPRTACDGKAERTLATTNLLSWNSTELVWHAAP